jgi:hypothetical protein
MSVHSYPVKRNRGADHAKNGRLFFSVLGGYLP